MADYWRDLQELTGMTPLIVPGAAGAIMKDGSLLLVRHKGRSLWQIPGGIMEFGESLEDAIRREIREELGIDMAIDSLVAVMSSSKWNGHFRQGNPIQSVTSLYLLKGEFSEIDIRLQEDEIEGYSFFPLDGIPDDTFECCKVKAKMMRSFLETGKPSLEGL